MDTVNLVYRRDFAGFSVLYYLTARKVLDESTGAAYDCYGVLLEKFRDGEPPETAGAFLSEHGEDARRALEMLYVHEVTPVSLYEVIDTVLEKTCGYQL